jgi:hypothetical protein
MTEKKTSDERSGTQDPVDLVSDWWRRDPRAPVLISFALGVFLGVLLRD